MASSLKILALGFLLQACFSLRILYCCIPVQCASSAVSKFFVLMQILIFELGFSLSGKGNVVRSDTCACMYFIVVSYLSIQLGLGLAWFILSCCLCLGLGMYDV